MHPFEAAILLAGRLGKALLLLFGATLITLLGLARVLTGHHDEQTLADTIRELGDALKPY